MARLVTDEELNLHKTKNARAKRLTLQIMGEQVELVVRPPSRAEYIQYKALVNSDKPEENAGARYQLLVFCSMSPDPKTSDLSQLVDQYPALPDSIWPTLGKLAGITNEITLGE